MSRLTKPATLAAALLAACAALVPAGAADVAAAAAYPNPGVVKGNITVHDPSLTRGPSSYLLASTAPGIDLRTSTDRTNFTFTGKAFPNGAPWTDTYTGTSNGNLWAPDVTYRGGKYLMYYAASSFGSNRSAIFLATSATGAPGTWTNQGLVYSTTTSSNHNAIDPSLVVDANGAWWLSLGSFWTGIKMIQLDPSTGKRLASNQTVHSLASRPGSTAVEAPAILRHGGYYYLFTSWDSCCKAASSTYKIYVGRSTSITGPYVDRAGVRLTNGGGTQILASHDRYVGPGGQSVITDSDGDLLVYHYYDSADRGVAKLGVNLLGWDSSGWPYVR